jgi:hypothetical protein
MNKKLAECVNLIDGLNSVELNTIISEVKRRRRILAERATTNLRVGQNVKVNHKSAYGRVFIIEKINVKNVVLKEKGIVGGIRCSAALVEAL